ncbi:hypothetical protein DFH09DRAFT_1472439, partial [Mycena vulgaris]
ESSEDPEPFAELLDSIPTREDLRITMEFIRGLRDAKLEDEDLGEEVMHRLRHPLHRSEDVSKDPDLLHSLRLFLATTNASVQTYTDAANAAREHHPDDEILSYAAVKAKVAELSGIVPLVHDMCPNTCLAYTGSFENDDFCRICKESRWDPNKKGKIARQQYYTIPLGPQIQA